ncbi:hypothetical protein DY000_02037460 [Brassica cretica]|uniref:Uncharacterized protein n=1 Tax=Brassica cretica TaxID=69181 RepID=A0ABQ7BN95_BRACR|nr:hypothetical protein DY000_02037460 [Brassica cretica]
MASSCFEKPQEEEDHIKDEPYVYVEPPPFDASILTPAQLVTLNELQKKYPGSAKTSLARRIRVELIRDQAELEGRELEGICISTLELQLEELCLPCGENITHDLDSLVLINECLDLISETRKLDELRIEKLARDHIEVCFDKNYLCASVDLEYEFLMLNEPRPLLELADLGDELDVDRFLLEIENPHVKDNHENENIVFYLIDGDRVNYFVKTSFESVVDCVFPPYAFDSHDHLNLKEHFIIHVTSLVKLFEEKFLHVPASCTATPQAFVDSQLFRQLPPRSYPIDQATSSSSVHLSDFGPFGIFSTREQS